MSNFLKTMADSSRTRAESARRTYSDDELGRPVYPIRFDGFGVIAEIKKRSPAEGDLSASAGSLASRAVTYADGGASAISVLTEPDRFDGGLSDLETVVDAVADRGVPVMRKDFLVDPRQVLEAKAAGASGVLLIAAMLDVAQMKRMLDCAFEHGLFVLLESFDESDLEYTAHLLGDVSYHQQAADNRFLVGINSRNLRSLAVDPARLERFGALLPAGAVAVAESGLQDAADARQASGWGYRMALVGTALMRAEDPARLIGDMIAAGRSV
jgi:indole-3-glycerol phosphate synthase